MATITLTMDKKDIEAQQRAHAEFHHRYGVAMAMWAQIERGLFYWFHRASGTKVGIARAVFYSSRSFNGRAEMVQSIIPVSERISDEERDFLKAAIKRAWGYNSFRNRLAHGEPVMSVRDLTDGETTTRSVSYILVQGQQGSPDPKSVITRVCLANAAGNFRALSRLLMDAADKRQPPEECLRLVLELPTQANAKNSRTPEESESSEKPPARHA
jgi:hypothetical protein